MKNYGIISLFLLFGHWNLLIAQEMVAQLAHTSWVRDVVLSADGKTLISGAEDNTIKIWELPSGRLLRTFEGHVNSVMSVALSADGKTLASGGGDNTVKVWDVLTGRLLNTLQGHTNFVESITLSADGKILVSGSKDGYVKLWDLTTGHLLRSLEGHSNSVESVGLTLDGKTLVSGAWDNLIKVWDVPSGRLLRTLEGHTNFVESIALSSDGRTLVSGSRDNTIKIWDLLSGRLIRTLEGHTGGVSAIALSVDGKTLVSGSWDKLLKVWELSTGRLLSSLEGHTSWVRSVTLSADGKTLVSSSDDNTMKVWEMASGRLLRNLEGHTLAVQSLALSADGKTLVSGNKDKTVKVWEMESGRLIRTLEGHTGGVKSLVLSSDGRTLVSGSDDNMLKLWDIPSGRLLRTLEGHTNSVESVALSTDGRTLVSASQDRTVIIWEMPSGRFLGKLQESVYVNSLALSVDGRILATGDSENLVKIWEMPSGRLLRTLQGHEGSVECVALSGDGKTLVSGSRDNTVKVWEIVSGRLLRTLEGHTNYLESLTLSADGKTLISGDWDNMIKVWDFSSGRLLRTLKGHTNFVSSLATSADGKILISGSEDGLIKYWDLMTGNELWNQVAYGVNDYLVFTKQGLYNGSVGALSKVHYQSGLKSLDRPIIDPNHFSQLNIDFLKYNFFITKYWMEFQSDKLKSNLFTPKDEFETLQMYQQRQQQAKAFEVELIEKYRKRFNESQNIQIQGFKQIIKDSYKQITLNLEEVGTYDAEHQVFPVKINQKQDTLKVPLALARSFKENWQQAKVIADQQLDEDGITNLIFNIKVFHPLTQDTFPFGLQRVPLYLGYFPEVIVVEETGIPRLSAQVELEEPSGNLLLDAKEGANLKLVIKNEGKGTAHNIVTRINWAKAPEVNVGIADIIKTLAPGSSATIRIPMQAGLYIETMRVALNLSFQEEKGFPPAPINISIGTQGLKPPSLEFVESSIIEEDGNGNNVIENGEVIKVSAIIRNTGELPAENVKANILVGSQEIAVLQAGVFPLNQNLGRIQPKESKVVQFVFSINYRYQGGDNLPIQLQMSESFKNKPQIFPLGLKMKAQLQRTSDVIVNGNYGLLGERKDRALFFAVSDYKNDTLDLKNPVLDAENIAKELRDRYSFETEVIVNPTYDEIEKKVREYERLYRDNPENRYNPIGQLLIFFTGHGVFEDGSGYFLPKDVDTKRISRTAFAYPIWKPIIDNINCNHILMVIDACYSGTFDEKIANRSVDKEGLRPGENPKDKLILEQLKYKARYYLTSGAKVETPDKSNFAKRFLEGLRSYKAPDGVFNAQGLYSVYLSRATPSPVYGSFGKNDAGSSFLFISKE